MLFRSLKSYKDKAFIMNILCELSYNQYTFYKNIINIPLILINTAMTILNSIIEKSDDMKIPNIILNSSTGLIIAFISQYKIYEKINDFKGLYMKFNKLSTEIDKKLITEHNEITIDEINHFIENYNNLVDSIDYPISDSIKNKVKKQFQDKYEFPSILSVDLVVCDNKTCCV